VVTLECGFADLLTNETEASRLPPLTARIFLEQVKIVQRDKRGIRWHSEVIKRCLEIQQRSSSAYELMRRIVSLPSRRTLSDYSGAGYEGGISLPFLGAAVSAFLAEWERQGEKPGDRTVALLFDSMYLSKGLLSRRDGTVVGMAVRDDFSSMVAAMDEKTPGFGETGSEATELFLVMMRGLGGVAQERTLCAFPSAGLKAFEVVRILVSLLEVLSLSGIWPVLMVGDGHKVNQKTYQTLLTESVPGESFNYLSTHPFVRNAILVGTFDYVHVIKVARNNLLNSGFPRYEHSLGLMMDIEVLGTRAAAWSWAGSR
jgi:hypothetical protein